MNDDYNYAAWFLGPKAEHSDTWEKMLVYTFRDYVHWRRNYFPEDNVVINSQLRRQHELRLDSLRDELTRILALFKAQNPIYSPRYIAHMVSEQTMPSVVGYFAGMLYNANNISGESSPIGFPLELEVGKIVADMLGFDPSQSWTHISSGGTIANIEALWIARTVKFVPFSVREYCQQQDIAYDITLPDGSVSDIREADDRTLLHLAPAEAVRMTRRLFYHQIEAGRTAEHIMDDYSDFVKKSDYNISERGISHVLAKVGASPRVYLSPSAHYSLKKAVNVLGYGSDALEIVDVDENFRMNTSLLRDKLMNASDDTYIAAVLGIAGTTEEGAVDPIHKITALRNELSATLNRSFWLHIDSAWGGYVRSLFKGYDLSSGNMDDKVERCRVNINTQTGECIWCGDDNNYRAYLSFPEADSVTIDPHKLGYIPYPAGMVSIRHGLVTELIRQDAAYVFDKQSGLLPDFGFKIGDIGSYILEGSKPGAAAASCYLAHKTIPLDIEGHGAIIKSTLISTQRLQRLMFEHFNHFAEYDRLVSRKHTTSSQADGAKRKLFTFKPIHRPDTNLICYMMVPVTAENGGEYTIDKSYSLAEINELNTRLYAAMSVGEDYKGLQSIDFFVSRTRLTDGLYNYDSIAKILKPLGITRKAYVKEGLFVLRSTVMNPLYQLAVREAEKDYLYDFIVALHGHASRILHEFER